MATRNPTNWMWSQACDLLDEADFMHRQFFRLAASGQTRAAWEPPVDVLEDERRVIVIVALPGVSAECIQIVHESGTLIVRAERRIPLAGAGVALRRIEIPYGFFERRIQLPKADLEDATSELLNGCLTITFRKTRVA